MSPNHEQVKADVRAGAGCRAAGAFFINFLSIFFFPFSFL
jgi:hypothetical protein